MTITNADIERAFHADSGDSEDIRTNPSGLRSLLRTLVSAALTYDALAALGLYVPSRLVLYAADFGWTSGEAFDTVLGTLVPAITGKTLQPIAFLVTTDVNGGRGLVGSGAPGIAAKYTDENGDAITDGIAFTDAFQASDDGAVSKSQVIYATTTSATRLIRPPLMNLHRGEPIVLTANSTIDVPGAIVNSNITSDDYRGVGYGVGDTFVVETNTGVAGDLATGHVTSVNEVGGVTGYVLDTPGDVYMPTPQQLTTATSGIGVGFCIDLTEIDVSINPAVVTILTMFFAH